VLTLVKLSGNFTESDEEVTEVLRDYFSWVYIDELVFDRGRYDGSAPEVMPEINVDQQETVLY
jgi:hypothetical protein